MYSIFDQEIGLDSWMRKASDSPLLVQNQESQQSTVLAGGSKTPLSGTDTNSINSGELGAILSFAKKDFTDTTAGWIQGMDRDGVYKWLIGDALSSIDWSVTTPDTLTVVGSITATTGTIGGFTIGADYIRDAANSFGLASTVTGGDDVRFWAGDTFANRASADFRVTEAGVVTATSITATGTINATGGFIGAGTALVFESQGINTGTTGWIRGGMTDYNTGTGYFLGYHSTTYKFAIGNSSDTTKLLLWDGTDLIINNSSITNNNVFGDGSDGDVTISADTTLTSDVFYNNLTIQTGKVLNPGGYRIFVKGTLTFQGTGKIASNGGAGGAGGNAAAGAPALGAAGAAAHAAGSLPASLAGVAGAQGGNPGAGNNGNNGTAAAKSTGVAGVAGGAGGDGFHSGGGSHGAGGAASSGGAQTGTVYNKLNHFVAAYNLFDVNPAFTQLTGSAASGSGAGGGGSTDSGGYFGAAGGGSGAPGGFIWVAAKIVVTVNGNVYFQATGGAGGGGGAGNGSGGNGGGGGGGSGGITFLTYSILTGSGTVDVAGGAAGAAGSGSPAGSTAGTAGSSGRSYNFKL